MTQTTTIVVGFVVGTGPLAGLIAREEAEDVVPDQPHPLPTHVYVRDGAGSWSVEAVWPRVRALLPGSYDPPALVREYRITVDERARLRAAHVAHAALGVRYNIVGLLLCWLYMERRWRVPGWVPWRFCSQLALDVLRAAGLDACPGVPDDDCSPALLEAWVATHPLAEQVS